MKNISINFRTKVLTIFVLSLAVCFSETQAQRVDYDNLSGKVRRGSSTTYLDLFGKIFPGARAGKYGGLTAERSVGLRKLIAGTEKEASEKKIYTNEVKASFREDLLIGTKKEKYLLVYLEVSAKNETIVGADEKTIEAEKPMSFPVTVLALLRISPQPEFLDAVEVPGSVLVRLEATALQKYFWLVGAHQNCLTEYDDYTLLKIDGERINLIYADLPVLVVSSDCGTKLTQRPIVSLAGASARPEVDLTVVSAVKQFDEECTGRLVRKYTRYFRYRIGWDEKLQKYTARQNADRALRAELVKFGFAFVDEDEENN